MYRDRDARHRNGEDPQAVLTRFRAAKDALFAKHPQSPLQADSRSAFGGLHYFAYDARLRLRAALSAEESAAIVDARSSMLETMPLRRAAKVVFSVGGQAMSLTVFWIDVYGGGLFLPFRDASGPAESYGAGRYLFDTIKGSGFETAALSSGDASGYAGGEVIIDFNYAYNPSCAYDARWACPLAPRENWLPQAMRAGERKFEG